MRMNESEWEWWGWMNRIASCYLTSIVVAEHVRNLKDMFQNRCPSQQWWLKRNDIVLAQTSDKGLTARVLGDPTVSARNAQATHANTFDFSETKVHQQITLLESSRDSWPSDDVGSRRSMFDRHDSLPLLKHEFLKYVQKYWNPQRSSLPCLALLSLQWSGLLQWSHKEYHYPTFWLE